MKSLNSMNSFGDTIVEVLIAITVMSSILGGAFVSARRSTNTTRSAQERIEALAIAQGQLERARTTNVLPKCYKADGLPEPNTIDNCKISNLYTPEITSLVNGDFIDITVKVSWEGVGGIGDQNLRLTYRKVNY